MVKYPPLRELQKKKKDLDSPKCLTLHRDGSLTIVDTSVKRTYQGITSPSPFFKMNQYGQELPSKLSSPRGCSITPYGDLLLVDKEEIILITEGTGIVVHSSPNNLQSAVMDREGDIWFTENGALYRYGYVKKLSNGKVTTVVYNRWTNFSSLAMDEFGRIYVSWGGQVSRINSFGKLELLGELEMVRGMAIDFTGVWATNMHCICKIHFPVSWRPDIHFRFPKTSRDQIKTVMTLFIKNSYGIPIHPESKLGYLPKDMLFLILHYVNRNSNI